MAIGMSRLVVQDNMVASSEYPVVASGGAGPGPFPDG